MTHANALQLMSGAGSGEHVEVTAFLDKRGKRIAFVAVSAMCGDRLIARAQLTKSIVRRT